jgi:hypothetical protein
MKFLRQSKNPNLIFLNSKAGERSFFCLSFVGAVSSAEKSIAEKYDVRSFSSAKN